MPATEFFKASGSKGPFVNSRSEEVEGLDPNILTKRDDVDEKDAVAIECALDLFGNVESKGNDSEEGSDDGHLEVSVKVDAAAEAEAASEAAAVDRRLILVVAPTADAESIVDSSSSSSAPPFVQVAAMLGCGGRLRRRGGDGSGSGDGSAA